MKDGELSFIGDLIGTFGGKSLKHQSSISLRWAVNLLVDFVFLSLSTFVFLRDSDDDFRSGCRNVGQCHQQQSFSGLLSPGRSNHPNDLPICIVFGEDVARCLLTDFITFYLAAEYLVNSDNFSCLTCVGTLYGTTEVIQQRLFLLFNNMQI